MGICSISDDGPDLGISGVGGNGLKALAVGDYMALDYSPWRLISGGTSGNIVIDLYWWVNVPFGTVEDAYTARAVYELVPAENPNED